MQKESSLIKKLKYSGKLGAKILVGAYAALVLAEAMVESYHILNDKITSSQSYVVLRYALSYNKNFPDPAKTLFPGFFIAHTINAASNFGGNDYF
ncbi:hypothetical protein HYT25_04885 [Candidatus Pacearchaeota archaeon]|nr:hypothetical protein [Candidatus Pacearchaeota archaeon]